MVYYFYLRVLHYGHDPKNWKAIFQRGTCWMYFVYLEKNKASFMVNETFYTQFNLVPSSTKFELLCIITWPKDYEQGPCASSDMRIKMKVILPQFLFPVNRAGLDPSVAVNQLWPGWWVAGLYLLLEEPLLP